jgi:hypothetical protein
MTATHFTAWLTVDTTCLTGPVCDVAVLQDEAVSYRADQDGTESPVWGSTGDPLFHADTTVDAKDGDHDDAIKQAKELLDNAGWTITGDWDTVDTGYIATVERDTEDVMVYVVTGTSDAPVVEPAVAGIALPNEVMDWAATVADLDDTDVYLAVAPSDDAPAGQIQGQLGTHEVQLPAADVDAIRAAMTAEDEDPAGDDSITTVTLISALAGDRVPGTELADPECPQFPGLEDRPEVKAFFAENNYGSDEPDELMYLVTDMDQEIPAGFPTLTVRL